MKLDEFKRVVSFHPAVYRVGQESLLTEINPQLFLLYIYNKFFLQIQVYKKQPLNK